MKTPGLILTVLTTIALFTSSCRKEDPGFYQQGSKSFSETGFDRVNAGEALQLDIIHDSVFSIYAEGDIRNLDDLDVYTSGGTLHIRFDNCRYRKHETHLTIKMPMLRGADLSGATVTNINGFYSLNDLDLAISGASTADVDISANNIDIDVSGASEIDMRGSAAKIDMQVSGASSVKGFDMLTAQVKVDASGASSAKVHATQTLNAEASGASTVIYRGQPVVNAEASGGSSIRHE